MQTITLLIVEDNEADADYLRNVLRRAEDVLFDISVVGWLNSALTAVAAKAYDAVLLDLSLPDSQGLDTVVSLTQAAPEMPIIVMTGHDDMVTGVNAVRYGAQDYLLKGDVADRPLPRSIVYAIERKRADIVGKALLRESITSVTSAMPVASSPAISVKSHLEQFAMFLSDARKYIARNAPGHVDAFESIVSKHQLDIVLREIQALTRPDVRQTRPGMPAVKRISDSALETVRSVSKDAPVPPTTAKEALLGAIRSAEEIGTRNGGEDR